MYAALFCSGLAVGLIRWAITHPTTPKPLNLRTCGECYTTVSDEEFHPRCPECGHPLDIQAVA